MLEAVDEKKDILTKQTIACDLIFANWKKNSGMRDTMN